ncbi:MAG: PilZ domain-containing protein [Anaerovibrio sp.]|uniref:flagellar brake protein n=1 Tax=Anaerovibrio sp. TaxID=1872532 RepID=UPI0026161104|nr:PilZ domain-containing protein [Anaerovibrio sp.]MDD7678609.1 PilZ domain-containing protein [Anaerovibrio sp.]MDY2604500.1 PilZ domain-containing protein [Anaerovibrio sp.]MDY4883347.1 PilZ domain-containing protein [Anaerovibrio sp.]
MIKGERKPADMVLKIGARLTFFPLSTENGVASRVEDISGDRLMVAMPVNEKGVPILPLPGENMVCRIAGTGCYYKFNAVYLDKGKAPIPVWFVRKPEFVEKVQNREFVRISVDYPVILRPLDENGAMGGMIFTKAVDISGGGLAVMNKTMLPLGSKAVLELDNIPGVGMLRITGRVVRCVKVDAAGDNVFHVGFQFLDLSRQHQNRLVKFIFDIQRQSLAKGIGKK